MKPTSKPGLINKNSPNLIIGGPQCPKIIRYLFKSTEQRKHRKQGGRKNNNTIHMHTIHMHVPKTQRTPHPKEHEPKRTKTCCCSLGQKSYTKMNAIMPPPPPKPTMKPKAVRSNTSHVNAIHMHVPKTQHTPHPKEHEPKRTKTCCCSLGQKKLHKHERYHPPPPPRKPTMKPKAVRSNTSHVNTIHMHVPKTPHTPHPKEHEPKRTKTCCCSLGQKKLHKHERYHPPPPRTPPLKHCAGQPKIDKITQFPAVETSCVRAVTSCPREQQHQQHQQHQQQQQQQQ